MTAPSAAAMRVIARIGGSRVTLWMIAAVTFALIPTASWGQSWSKARDALTAQGITPSFTYDGAIASNLGGGAKRGTTYLGNFHFQLLLDGDKLVNWPGLTVFLNGLGLHGGQPSAYAGDAQGVSNIAGPHGFKLYEAWLQDNFFGAQFSALAGLYDLNSEFYRLQTAGLFLNSSFGIGPEFAQSGLAGPSIFPNTSVGARFAYKPAPNIVLRSAVLNGVPVDRPNGSQGVFERGDGLLLVGEAAFLNRPAPEAPPSGARFRIGRASGLPPYDDKLALGGWHYTANFNDLSQLGPDGTPAQRHGSGGVYAIADHLFFQGTRDPSQRVTGFLQLGIGDNRVNRFGSYIGAGMAAAGFIPGRSSDEFGLAVAAARNGAHYVNSQAQQGTPVTGAEIALELTYLAQLTDWIALQPDLQYVIHPNTNPALKNALVLQCQIEVSF